MSRSIIETVLYSHVGRLGVQIPKDVEWEREGDSETGEQMKLPHNGAFLPSVQSCVDPPAGEEKGT